MVPPSTLRSSRMRLPPPASERVGVVPGPTLTLLRPDRLNVIYREVERLW